MSPNMGTLDRVVRILIGVVALAIGVALGAGSVGGIVLFVFAGVMLATSAVGHCPLYAVFHIATRPAKSPAH
jgi:hypothetical protein